MYDKLLTSLVLKVGEVGEVGWLKHQFGVFTNTHGQATVVNINLLSMKTLIV